MAGTIGEGMHPEKPGDHEPPPLELTLVVEPFQPPSPPAPPPSAPRDPVAALAVATAAGALAFAALTWWTVGG